MTYPRKGSKATRKADGMVGMIYASDPSKDVLTVRWWTGSKFDTRVCTREGLLKEWDVAEKPHSTFNFIQSLDRFIDHCGRMSKLCFDAAKSLAAIGIGVLVIVFIYDVRHDTRDTARPTTISAAVQQPLDLENAQSLSNQYGLEAAQRCATGADDYLRAVAKYDFAWDDVGLMDFKFDKTLASVDGPGVLQLYTKKAKLQNGFGAYKHIILMCDYDTQAHSAVFRIEK